MCILLKLSHNNLMDLFTLCWSRNAMKCLESVPTTFVLQLKPPIEKDTQTGEYPLTPAPPHPHPLPRPFSRSFSYDSEDTGLSYEFNTTMQSSLLTGVVLVSSFWIFSGRFLILLRLFRYNSNLTSGACSPMYFQL